MKETYRVASDLFRSVASFAFSFFIHLSFNNFSTELNTVFAGYVKSHISACGLKVLPCKTSLPIKTTRGILFLHPFFSFYHPKLFYPAVANLCVHCHRCSWIHLPSSFGCRLTTFSTILFPFSSKTLTHKYSSAEKNYYPVKI